MAYFIKNTRNNDQLVLDGFIYNKHKTNLLTVNWNCVQYKKNCRGFVIQNGADFKLTQEHNHLPSFAEIEAKKVLIKLKQDAISSTAPPKRILSEALAEINEYALAKLPSLSSLSKKIHRKRDQHEAFPKKPTSMADFIILPPFLESLNSERFLQFDSGPAPNRVLIFFTQSNLELLESTEHWMVDGTFKSAPNHFYQLWSIHGLIRNTAVPLVYAVLPHKDTNCYTRVLENLNMRANLLPTSVMMDYEKAEINAFNTVFPDATIRGCFFHFGQNLWRHIQEEKTLCNNYLSDDLEDGFNINLRKFYALAFVPEADVVNLFEELLKYDFFQNSQNYSLLANFILYFEKNYIGIQQANGLRSPPTFAHATWNQYQAVLSGLPRTNNHVEGWHRALNASVGTAKPNIWTFIKALQREQSFTDAKVHQLQDGVNMNQNPKYAAISKRLLHIVANYKDYTPLSYLHSIAKQLKLQ